MKTDIHIGTIIKKKFEESGLTIPQFAKSINRTRTTIYDIFNRKSIDTDLLIQISDVLGYNFLEEVYMKEVGNTLRCYEVKGTSYIVGVEVSEEQLKDIDTKDKEVILIKRLKMASPK